MKFILESIFTFFRGFGFFILILSLLVGFLLSKWNYILLGLFLISELIINIILKNTFRIIMGNNNFPIIGKGTRPDDAISCGFFTPRTKINKIVKSFGMPSGHSQTFAFIATLIGIHLYNIQTQQNTIYKYITLIILTLLAMYMRVYIEKCHTIQQTIVGSIIGIGLAFLFTKYFGNPFDETHKEHK
jgi:membrane-associated phospholipid phosphatase